MAPESRYFLTSAKRRAIKTNSPPAPPAFVGLRRHKIFVTTPFWHFWAPPAIFLGPAGDIFGLRRRYFWAPPAIFLGSADYIFGLRRRHFWAPPATFLGFANNICGLNGANRDPRFLNKEFLNVVVGSALSWQCSVLVMSMYI